MIFIISSVADEPEKVPKNAHVIVLLNCVLNLVKTFRCFAEVQNFVENNNSRKFYRYNQNIYFCY